MTLPYVSGLLELRLRRRVIVRVPHAKTGSFIQVVKQDFILILSRDKRVHHHTFGLFLLCWPCGIVVCFDELFGSEGKMQLFCVLNWIDLSIKCS